jgi:hypothetical protein
MLNTFLGSDLGCGFIKEIKQNTEARFGVVGGDI